MGGCLHHSLPAFTDRKMFPGSKTYKRPGCIFPQRVPFSVVMAFWLGLYECMESVGDQLKRKTNSIILCIPWFQSIYIVISSKKRTWSSKMKWNFWVFISIRSSELSFHIIDWSLIKRVVLCSFYKTWVVFKHGENSVKWSKLWLATNFFCWSNLI